MPGQTEPVHTMARLGGALVALWAGAAVVIFFSQADLWLYRSGLSPLRPTVLYLALSVPLALVVLARQTLRPDGGGQILRLLAGTAPVWLPWLALTGSAALATAFAAGPPAEHLPYLALYGFDLGALGLALLLPLLPSVRHVWPVALVVGLGVIVLAIAADVSQPGTFSRVLSRAAGPSGEPNAAAFLLVSGAALTLRYERFRGRDALLLAAVAVAMLATLSRGGFLLLGLLVVFYLAGLRANLAREAGPRRPSRGLRLAGVAALALALALAIVAAGRSHGGLFDLAKTQERLAMFSGGDSFLADSSDRRIIFTTYLMAIAQAPWLGHGPGYVYGEPKGPHNRYLHEWVSGGLPGLISYLVLLAGAGLFFAARGDRRGLAFVVLLAAWGLFSHTYLDYRAVLLPLGLAAGTAWLRCEAPAGE
ncbi:MAG TPA: O-antigen ligase family protein [Thermoanaerobaculia bacterium]|nr:O-antigen ligase family protein [Thermoanaerobaculia bacterium]